MVNYSSWINIFSLDTQATIDTLVKAADCPISVVIVGVGSNSFNNCKRFDADDEPLVDRTGKKQSRDIVQVLFVSCGSETL